MLLESAKETELQGVELFIRYVDDKMRMVKSNSKKVLQIASILHPQLQFTIETLNALGNPAFLDLESNIDMDRRVSCGWYQNQQDTGTILKFRSCVALRYKKSVIEVTVHRVFRSTSNR